MPKDNPELLARMKELLPGYYTERDGYDWYCLAPNNTDHGRVAEDFVKRDDARRVMLWLAGDPLPKGWSIKPARPNGNSCHVTVEGQYSDATIWVRPCLTLFPNRRDALLAGTA